MNDQGQYPEKIRELYARKNLDLELAIRKGEYQYQKNINLEVEKNKIRQFNKEIESARFESVTLGANGKLEVKISNPIMSIPARHFGNFDFLEISELVGMESGERGIFNLILNIEGCKTFAFIIGNKAGNGNYLLEKFSSIGARFYIEKKVRLQRLLLDFWAIMMNNCMNETYVPEHYGWIKDIDDGFNFIEEGKLLWKDVKKMAK